MIVNQHFVCFGTQSVSIFRMPSGGILFFAATFVSWFIQVKWDIPCFVYVGWIICMDHKRFQEIKQLQGKLSTTDHDSSAVRFDIRRLSHNAKSG